METYLGLDLGSSGVKAVALDATGAVVASAKRPLGIATGPSGAAEQSPAEWRELAGECLRELNAKPAAVAFTGQMNGPVLLDAAGEPLGPVQMWCDTRCAAQCARIDALVPPAELLEVTGHAAVTGYTAPKLMWLADHAPDTLRRAAQLLFPKDFLAHALTGRPTTDLSDASNSLLFDVRRGEWSRRILAALGLSGLRLPSPLESAAVAGRVTAAAAGWSGLPEGTPVAAGAGDSIAAALGAGLRDASEFQVVIGTAGNVNCVLDRPTIDPRGRVHTGFFVDRGHWIASGVQQSAGSCLAWWAGITGRTEAELLAEAADGTGGALFAPYLSGERTPHLDPGVRAAFAGLGRETTRAGMTRALLEGVALSFRDAAAVFAEIGVRPQRALVCGGGASSDAWCGIVSAALGLPVARLAADTTARGAAMLAALAAGRFASWKDAAAGWSIAAGAIAPARLATDPRAFQRLYPCLKGLKT